MIVFAMIPLFCFRVLSSMRWLRHKWATTTLIIALIATTAVALGILAWQYRQEIKQAYDKLRHRGTK